MTEQAQSLLNALRRLEEQARSLKSDLARETERLRKLKECLFDARNVLKGHEHTERQDHPNRLAAQADCEQLEPKIVDTEAKINVLKTQLQEAHAALAEITEGPERTAVYALGYHDAVQQAARTLDEFKAATRKYDDAVVLRDAAATQLASAEQDRAQALDPDAMVKARATLTLAQADRDDAEILLANLARLVEERRAKMQKETAAVVAAHQRFWEAMQADEIAALHADFEHLHKAFAAGRAAGKSIDYGFFAREVMTASPPPADLAVIAAPMVEAFGVPARPPKFAA